MRGRKHCLLSRCLAVLLAAVLMFSVVGYAPEAKAASQFETGFYKPLDGLKKTSGFVPYRTAVSNGKTYTSAHLATDYSTTTGQWNVMAVYDGTVYKVNNALNSGAGRYVTLKHEIGGKTVYSLYQHLQKISVSVGQEIKGGQVIAVAGRSGTTENQYDRHLHIILYSGKNAWVTDTSAFAGKYEKGAEANGPISYGGTTYYNPARVFSGACVIGDGSYLGQKVIDSTPRTAISIKPASGEDQCYIKKEPLEDSSDKSASVPKGNTIKLVGAVENKHGNIWYKTEDGGYVYSGDIIFYQDYFSISAKFKNTERRSSHKLPFVDSDEVKTIGKDDIVQVSKFVLNSYGNIWAQLTDGSYLCFYDKETGENKLQFSAHVTDPSISGASKPTGDRTVGTSFTMKGVITAEVPFLSVSSRIIDRETEKDAEGPNTPVTAKPTVNTRSVDIGKKVNGVNIDTSTKFNKLGKGWYRYEINAQFGFTYEGKTFKFGGEKNFISSNFSVGKAGQTEPNFTNDPFAQFNSLFKLSAKFKNTEKRSSHKAPYLDSPEVKTIGKDDVVEVTEFVTNSYGNVWAKLTDGSYLCFYDCETGENKLQFSSHVTQPSISDATKPTGDINVTNQGFWLKGTVKSGVPFLSVSTRIINRETGNDVEGRSPISVSPSASTREVVIYKKDDSNCLDSRTIFNNLPKGWYQYQLNAQFGFTYEGKTFKFGGAHNFITSDFTVGNPGTLETTPTPEVKGSLTIGNATKNGDILEIPVGIQGNPGLVGIGVKVDLPNEIWNFNVSPVDIGKDAIPYTEGVNGGETVALLSTGTMTGDGNLFKIHINTAGIDLTSFALKVTCVSAGDANGKEVMFNGAEKIIQLPSDRIPGDADNNGTVDWADVILALKYTMKLSVSINLENAEVTADGIVDWSDVILLLKYVMKLNVQLQ